MFIIINQLVLVSMQKGQFQLKKQQIELQQPTFKQVKASHYIPGQNNGKWNEKQHIKYVAFIDFYKEKMRSKEKRRSNEFYKQMSDFIGTRNGLQCRSHHQKLQEKYVYTNKIIAAFRDRIDPQDYKKCIFKLKIQKKPTKQSASMFQSSEKKQFRPEGVVKQDAQCQTELQGVNTNYVLLNGYTVGVTLNQQPFMTAETTFFFPGNYFVPSQMRQN